jgi:hypothetical protein
MALKHIGRMVNNKRKVVVAYRVLPGDPENCLVIATENLDSDQHDSLMKTLESSMGQDAYEFAEAMARATLPDGRNMLAGLHRYGKLSKVSTDSVELTPDSRSVINLAELNQVIATQKGVTVADLALQSATKPADNAPAKSETVAAPVINDGILTDEQLAAQYRSQADSLYKEAKRLREQAEELVPTKKKTKESAAEEV